MNNSKFKFKICNIFRRFLYFNFELSIFSNHKFIVINLNDKSSFVVFSKKNSLKNVEKKWMKNVFIHCFILMHRQIRVFQIFFKFVEFFCSCFSIRNRSCFFIYVFLFMFFLFMFFSFFDSKFIFNKLRNIIFVEFVKLSIFFVRNHRHFFDFSHIHFRYKTFFFMFVV